MNSAIKETLTEQTNILLSEYLTPTELYIIRIILAAQEDGDYSYLKTYLQIPEEHREDLHGIFVSLQRKAVLLQHVRIPKKGEKFQISDIQFNKGLVKRLHKASFDMGRELFEVYPQFCSINGTMVQINTVSKKFNSLEDAFAAYGKAIRNNPEEHNKIIELVKWAKENNIINCSLASFIIDRRWTALESLKDGDAGVNYDAIKLI